MLDLRSNVIHNAAKDPLSYVRRSSERFFTPTRMASFPVFATSYANGHKITNWSLKIDEPYGTNRLKIRSQMAKLMATKAYSSC